MGWEQENWKERRVCSFLASKEDMYERIDVTKFVKDFLLASRYELAGYFICGFPSMWIFHKGT